MLTRDTTELVASLKISESQTIGSCVFNSTDTIVNTNNFSYILTFSENINTSLIDAQLITNAGTAVVSSSDWSVQDCGDGRTFKIESLAITSDGTVIPDVSNLVAALTSTNKQVKLEADPVNLEIDYDTQSPGVQINQSALETIGTCSFSGTNDPTNNVGFSYKVSFSEKINPSTFAINDITNIGTGGSSALTWDLENCGDNQNFKLTALSITGDGSIIPIIMATRVSDVAGNANTISVSLDNSITYDTASLLVSINQGASEVIGACNFSATVDPANSTGFSYKILFSKNINSSTFNSSDIINAGTSGTVSWSLDSCGDNRTFKLTATSIQHNGTVVPEIDAGSVADTLGNTNADSTGIDNTVTYDTIAPSVIINQSIAETVGSCSFGAVTDPTNSAGFSYKVIFSENIQTSSFTTADIVNNGTSGAVSWNLESCSNQVFKLTATSIASSGTVVPVVSAMSVSDLAGNTNTISTSTDNSVTYDTTVPAVTINQAIAETVGTCSFSATTDPTNATGFSYKVTFSEAINASTFATSDITNAGTGGATALTWTLNNCGDDQNFKLTASSITGSGTIIPTLPAGRVFDASGNTNSIATATDNSVTYDVVAPTVTINQAVAETVGTCSFSATTDPTNATGFSYRVTFSEAINASTFATSDIANTGTGGGTTLTWTLNNCGDDRNFKLVASSVVGIGTIIPGIPAASVSDLAGNTNSISTSADNTITFDNVVPTVTINQATAETVGSCSFNATNDPTSLTGFSYKVIFSEAINLSSFTSGDIVNNGTSGIVVWNLEHCEDSQVFKLTATSIVMDGTVIPVVSASSVSDLAGNLNTISTSTDNSVRYDSTKPSLTINQAIAETVGSCGFSAASDPTNTAGFSYRVTFTEAIDDSSFAISDITNIGTGGGTTLTWVLENCGDNQNYKLTASAVDGAGTIIPRVNANQVYDVSGNLNTISTATDNTVTFDTIKPSVTINQATTQTIGSCSFSAATDPTNTAGFSYRVTFSEAVNASTFEVGDIVNSGTGGVTTLTWALSSCGDNLNFKLTANTITGDGTIIPNVSADGVSDLAGNLNNVSTSTDNSVTYDTTGPSITISRSIAETVGSCSFTATNSVEGGPGFNFKIAFSEKIDPATFAIADVTNTGTGGATTLTWALTNCGDDQNYRLNVSAITGEGTVIPQIAAARLTDVLGNQNLLSTSSNGTVTYELLGWSQQAYIKAVNSGAGDYFGYNTISLSGDTLVVAASYEDSSATTITNGTGFSEPGTMTDSGAVYVYKRTGTTWEQEAYIKAVNNGSSDYFGASVSLSGDTLAVGAFQEDSSATTITNGTGVSDPGVNNNSGAVYVYKRSGSTWTQEAYIKAINNGSNDYFGRNVAISGDTLAVGAYSEDSNSTVVTNGAGYSETAAIGDSGAVYVYKRTGTSWAQEAYVKASNSGNGDNFGYSISLTGDTLAVGAPYEDSSATTITNGTSFTEPEVTSSDSGAVYVYKRTGNNWQQEAYIKAVNNSATDYFGNTLSLSGDTLSVGVYGEDSSATTITNGTGVSDTPTSANSGAVYVYKRTGVLWVQEAYIKASNNGSGDYFGGNLSISGDSLAVGAHLEDSNATTITNGTGFSDSGSSLDSGAVYVYKRIGNNWEQEAYIKASNNGNSDFFGNSLSISGDTLAVGAYQEDSSATTITNGAGYSDPGLTNNSGAVYVYRNNARVFNTPDVFTTNVLGTSITLNWIKSGFKTIGYKIAYAQGSTAPVDCNSGTVVDVGNATNYTFNSLTAGTYYSFRVCSYDSVGNLSSGYVVSFPTASALPEPGDLSYVVNSDREVTFSWASAGGSVTGYKIAYQQGSTPPTSCNSGTVVDVGNVVTYQLTGLLTNTNYGIRVCSYDNSANLSLGKYISAKTNLAINPVDLYTTSTATSNDSLRVYWTNASDRITGFILTWAAGTTAPASCSVGNIIDAGNVTNYTVSGLVAGATYSVRVCAYEAGVTNTSSGSLVTGNVRDTGWVQEAYIKAVNSGSTDYFGYYLAISADTLAVTSYLEDSSATTITNGTGFSEPGIANESGAVYVYKRTGSNWQQEAYVKAVNSQETDYFGASVSLSGDTLAVGAFQEDSSATTITNGTGVSDPGVNTNSGAVYVYKRSGSTWTQEAYIKAINNGSNDYFGRNVAISGDTLAVGAYSEDSNSTIVTNGSSYHEPGVSSNSGAVYVYKRTGNNWAQEAYVKASNTESDDSFGYSISLSGDTLAVGAYQEDSSATTITNGVSFSEPGVSSNSGAVYVYKRTGNNWQQEAYVKASNSGASDSFGYSVSLAGNTLAVGAHQEDSSATTITNGTGFSDTPSSSNSGAVYVYKRTGTEWAQEAYIKASNNGSSDFFGASVAINGDTLAVGAYGDDSAAMTITNGTGFSEIVSSADSGAAYVYKRTGSSWQQEAYVKGLHKSTGDSFGRTVVLSGDTLAVGAFYEDSSATTITNGTGWNNLGTTINSGAVYVYRNNARVFNTPDVFTTNVLGTSITLNWIKSGFKTTGYKIAYAQGSTAPVDCNSGTVVDVGNATNYTFNSLTAGTYYSFRVCSYDSVGNLSSGYVVSFPTASALPEPGDLSYVVNSDREVTFSWASAGGSVTGYKIAYQQGSTPPTSCNSGTVVDVGNVVTYQLTGLLTNTNYGIRVCSYDNSANLSLGKYTSAKTNLAINPVNLYATSTATSNDSLRVYWTNASDRITGFILTWAVGTTAPASCSVGNIIDVGNVTNYTISSLTAGATYSVRICAYEAGVTNTSTGSLARGNVRDTGWVQEAYIKAINSGAADYFGTSLSISGDTLAVGAYLEDSSATTITNGTGFSEPGAATDSGAVYVYKRTGTSWAQEAYVKAVNSQGIDYFGYSVSLSGDTLAVGAFQEDSASTTITNGTAVDDFGNSFNSGAVYVYKRTGSTWAQEAYIKAVNNGSNDYFGRSVSINRDTLVVGAYSEDSNATTITNGAGFSEPGTITDSGAAYVYKRAGSTWAQEAYIKASNSGSSDYFGHIVAIDEDTLVVGAYGEDSSATTITNGTGFSEPGAATDSGAVYVYKRNGANWQQEAYIKASNTGASDNFGNSISIRGDTLAVGAYLEDSSATTITNGTGFSDPGVSTNSGAVYVYKRTGSTWAQEAYIKAVNNLSAGDYFGNSVALSGNTLVVGAPREDSNATTITNSSSVVDNSLGSDNGSVYVYKRVGAIWQQEAYIKAVNGAGANEFGGVVSISGDTLAIGSTREDSNATVITNGTGLEMISTLATDSGAVHVYRNNARLFDITEVFPVVTSSSIYLKWQKTGGTAIGYGVNYEVGAVAPQLCSTTMDYDLGNVNEFLLNSLTADTDYTFRLCVYDSLNNFIEDKVITLKTLP